MKKSKRYMNPMSPDEKNINKWLIEEMRKTFSKMTPMKNTRLGERAFLIRPAPF